MRLVHVQQWWWKGQRSGSGSAVAVFAWLHDQVRLPACCGGVVLSTQKVHPASCGSGGGCSLVLVVVQSAVRHWRGCGACSLCFVKHSSSWCEPCLAE
jgi:hypothetical protein